MSDGNEFSCDNEFSDLNKNETSAERSKKNLAYDAYEELADLYASLVDTKPHNAYYDRPAVQSLITGGIEGMKILDLGCGPGVYAEWLAARGAIVTAIDASDKMIGHAKKRVKGKGEIEVLKANMEEPFDFFDAGTFDGVLSALAITYIKDHAGLFGEINRVLKKGGWFVFSTEHPFFSYRYFGIKNYFETRRVCCDWEGFGKSVNMPSYYHSLGSISEALSGSGFVIEKILEPKPVEEFRKADERGFEKLMKFPLFICFRAKKIEDAR